MSINKPIKIAYKILLWQLLLITGLALMMFFIAGRQGGAATLLGGLAYWVPSLVFVWGVFTKPFARAAKQFLIKFVTGEAIKLLVSGILFLIVVQFFPEKILSVLIGFVGAVMAFWFASMFLFAGEVAE